MQAKAQESVSLFVRGDCELVMVLLLEIRKKIDERCIGGLTVIAVQAEKAAFWETHFKHFYRGDVLCCVTNDRVKTTERRIGSRTGSKDIGSEGRVRERADGKNQCFSAYCSLHAKTVQLCTCALWARLRMKLGYKTP